MGMKEEMLKSMKDNKVSKAKKENVSKETKAKDKVGKQKAKVVMPSKSINTLKIEHTLNKMFYTMRDNLVETRAGLHASSIIASDSEFCYRAQLLSLFYEQAQGQNLPVGLLKIFAAGTSIHEKWQNMFEKGGICIKNEARSFSDKYDLYFTPDSIVEIDGKTYVVEIKSMNTFAFSKATSHPSGQKQCMLYMHLLGIENGFVLAEDKNNQEFKIFPVEYDYEKVAPFLDRLNEIQEMKKAFLEDKAVPPRKCESSTCKKAENCNMRDCCFGVGKGRHRLKYD